MQLVVGDEQRVHTITAGDDDACFFVTFQVERGFNGVGSVFETGAETASGMRCAPGA